MKIVVPMLGLQRNGGNRIVFAIVNQLVVVGHEVEILTVDDPGQPGFSIDERVDVNSIRFAAGPKVIKWAIFVVFCAWKSRGRIVLANHFLTAVSSRISEILDSKTKILYYVQDLEFRFYPWPISKLAYLFCKWTYATKNLIPANGYIEKSLNDLGFDTLRSPGLGVADYFIDEPKSEVHKTIDVVIFIRRGRHKNLRESYRIVRSLRMLGLTVCAIAPESSLIRPLEGVIEEWKINPSEGEILLALDSARLMLLTSKHEGFSLPPLEAMARGLPVVMFSCGGPLEYAENKKNALISGYGDSDDLVNNIQYLLDDMNLYERLSKNAESTARKYRLSNSIKKTVRLINTCLQTL